MWIAVAALMPLAYVSPAAAANNIDGAADAAGGAAVSSLIRFYPTPLATSPVGAKEDKAVWLAKVQGLIEDAPPLLQQSMLASKTQKQFAANLALLEQMQQGTLQQGATAVRAVGANGNKATKAASPENLGDTSNLVYTALAPCRIMDTRSATAGSGVQGPIAGNVLKQIPGYVTLGSNWGQYGGNAASNCGLNNTVGGAIHAVAIVITLLNPNFDAYLGVSDSSTLATVLGNVALNYTHGEGISTMYIVPQLASNVIYFAMPAGLSANIIFDVVGYFALSQATALECVDLSSGSTVIAANGVNNVTSPSCAAGYQMTSGSCIADNFGVFVVASQLSTTQFCAYSNTTAFSSSIHAVGRCCRVPGR